MEPNMEKSFFDILGALTGSFAQTGYIIGGTVLLLIGGVLLADWLRWKAKAVEVEGEVIGLKPRGDVFLPVYRYTLDGVTQEAVSNTGSSSISGQDTGTLVKILILRSDPARAQPARAPVWPMLGLLLAAPGGYMVWMGFNHYEVTGFTWATLATLAIISFNRFRRSIIPKNQRLSREERRLSKRMETDSLPVYTAEDIRQSPEMARREARNTKQAAVTGPLLILVGAAALAGALYFGSDTIDLLGAESAGGEVIQLAYNSDGNYSAIVKFNALGRDITFRDKVATRPPLYDEGEKVNVLYKKDNAEQSAVIDRGALNWIVPGALGLFGILFLMGGIARMPRQRDVAL